LLDPATFNREAAGRIYFYLDQLKSHYIDAFNLAVKKKETLINFLENSEDYDYKLDVYMDKYFNESLSDLVRNITVSDRVIVYNGRLIQQIDPVFNVPEVPANPLNYRSHFFAPVKYFGGRYIDTFYFNLLVIWFMSLLLYITLYFELFKKFIDSFGKLKFKKK
jgi:ABC transport system ATP-binding/permease protein